MPNPLFSALAGQQNAPADPLSLFMEQFRQTQKTFKGDPRAEVQRLLSTGQMSQQQFNQLGQMANQIMGMFPK